MMVKCRWCGCKIMDDKTVVFHKRKDKMVYRYVFCSDTCLYSDLKESVEELGLFQEEIG